MNDTTETQTELAYVLRLPRKGNFAPIKIGCRKAKFIRTLMPNGLPDMWIAHGKIYTDIKEFNEMCAEVTPAAYNEKLTAYAEILEIKAKVETPIKKEEVATPEVEVESASITGLTAPTTPSISFPSPPKVATKKKPKKLALK